MLIPAGATALEEVDLRRQPPHNYMAEQALLGAILTNNRVFEKISEFLRAEHFADGVHGRIFAACGKLIERGQLANPVTLSSYLSQDGALAEIGGPEYLARLANSVVTIINAEDYGRLIFDLHLRRELIDLGEEMVNQAFDIKLDEAATDQIETAEARLFELATNGAYEGGFLSFKEAVIGAITMAEAAHKREGKLAGVPTGLNDLDKKMGGLHPSDLVILAGRPSMGKTALATNIAFNAAAAYREERDAMGNRKAADGAVVAFYSLEMSAEQLATRILSEQARVESHKIRQGEMSHEEFERLVQASQELHRLPLFIDDTPALSISAVRTRSRRLKRQHGLGCIVVDYLQLLRGSLGARIDNRVQEISDITRGLKALAKELEVPVIALSQLSRAVEQREDKRPQLSDLRESGSIEQDADVVMFVYREQYYLERAEPGRRPEESEEKFNERYSGWQQRCEQVFNTAEVILAKQRHGPIGTVRLFFDGNYTKFGNLDREYTVEETE
ncbi:MAG: replicative DNA helicase [Rhodospirillales bacterium]|nr:replicative DNA helicase [Rhodospirillales bacterium]